MFLFMHIWKVVYQTVLWNCWGWDLRIEEVDGKGIFIYFSAWVFKRSCPYFILFVFNIYLQIIYLFGCIGSQLQHMGPLLQPVGFSLARLFKKLPLYRFPDAIFKIALKVMNRSIKFIINIHLYIQFDFQFSSVTQSCLTLCDPMDCSKPGFPVHQQLPESLLKLMSIESVRPSNHLILCHPLLLLRSIFPSIRIFSNESILHIR